MKEIQLTNSSYVAQVDNSRYDEIMKLKWCKGKDHAWSTTNPVVSMHVYLFGKAASGKEWDHIDCNGLNNCEINLRQVTHQQNMFNRNKPSGQYSSQYKGVCWDKERQKWIALIMLDYKSRYLGRFDDEEQAAIAYDLAAKELFGEYANLNFREVDPNSETENIGRV